MGEKLVIGPINRGLKKDRTAFVIDNDSFPTLINAYQWRGRVKRKRGTKFLTWLKRYFNSASISYNTTSATITLDGSGEGNLITGYGLDTASPNANLVQTSVSIVGTGPVTYTDDGEGNLFNGLINSGTIDYVTGDISIPTQAGNVISATFNYHPSLPVMGLEDLALTSSQFPQNLSFDTVYSYQIQNTFPYDNYDVSFYKNLATNTYPSYVQKTTWTPTTWNGEDYQQFWSVNYQGALWATNGINVPFSATNVGMQYKPIVSVTGITGGPPATATLNILNHGLVVGDFVFINEVVTTTGINFQTGYVITVTDANNVIVEFPNATIASNGTGGIAQYLTSRSDKTKDCIRWYDGDPTDGNATTPSFTLGRGWVNFAPPLSFGNFSIADLPAAKYYLVGARMIVPFKDRLLFIGPVVQTSSAGSQRYLQDTVIYSQNGTPYYTSSFTYNASAPTDPTLASIVFTPILVPDNQTATAPAYFEDQTGFGGFISAGISQPIISASTNEDVLILGFSNIQSKLVYSGNDVIPFNFYLINSELGTGSTFSAINMDMGVLSRGDRGYIITGQTEVRRIDLDIPDEVFQIHLQDNGSERFCAQRDFINEWVYFTYPVNSSNHIFPTQTLQFNYRDNSWGIFNESYTTYGAFREQTGFTWQTVGRIFPSWIDWNESWDAGSSTLLQPKVIGGNSQGFVLTRDEGTGEGTSLFIQGFTGNLISCPGHCLNDGDYIYITSCLGTVADSVNNKIFSVYAVSEDTFRINPSIDNATYLGGGLISRFYVPIIQTKQFPLAWDMGRKTRIGVQQYLLSTTEKAQIQLLIFLSQNSSDPYNTGTIIPTPGSINDSLIYSTVLYTCPESTNLGLTPANVNLQTPTALAQSQIWHRMNTSLIGDTVQIGFTLSDTQMRTVNEDGSFISQNAEIELHSIIMDVSPSQVLV